VNASTARMCKSTTKAGAACRVRALSGSDLCWFHDPATSAARKEARSRGGRARHGRHIGTTNTGEPVTISDLGDVVKLLERTINDALSLENSLSRANTIARLAGVLCSIYQASELEARIVALESQGVQ